MLFDSTPWLFVRDGIENADDAPGIYALFAKDGRLLYIGQSEVSVRSRLLRHIDGKEGAGTQQAFSYRYYLCTDSIKRESDLLAAYFLNYGQLPPCNGVLPRG